MWLAVCSEKLCQWDHVTNSPTLASAELQRHILETNHRGVMVDVPSPDPQRQVELKQLQFKPAA